MIWAGQMVKESSSVGQLPTEQKLTPAAKAVSVFCSFYGTAEAVPLAKPGQD